ncbi:recombinase family protein [Amycolatopsis thermoflava]|uniref:recombinase family protein n=1 Tax=Amycolatopsis thermoflava TaxID=84480 RepID=UPI003EBD52AC
MGGPEAIRAWAGPRRVDRSHALAGPAARTEPSFIRVAFAGRTSTYDQQDPTLSIPRQLRTCHGVLPDTAVIVAHFYDIESGRKDLSDRGRGRAHELFQIPVPRDGGIQDLLDEAERPDRRFDVVICEDISRVGRRSYASTEIEHRLEKAGVMLIAADEPFQLNNTGRRSKTSTQVLTRRVKQGVAEWYVIEMLEKSWDGFETHTEQGYNVGKPCYGYRAKKIPHPVPAKRAKGIKKTLLEVHPVEGAVVRRSFGWRVVERLGYQAIADRLNQDLVTNPPPIPIDPNRAVGIWTYSNVRDMLTNPKHTGHMVWNRRARKGGGRNRMNPVSEWVWSPEPAHEALIDLETYVQAQQVAERRERSRTASKSRNPQAKRIYKLRSYIFCVSCGRRLYGKTKRQHAYYVCAPKKAWVPEGHPSSTYWVRERNLLEGLTAFLAAQVFGPYRRELLDASLRTIDDNAQQERQDRIIALRRSITETETKSKRLVRSLEIADDVDQAFIRDINERRAELRSHKEDLERQLAKAEDEVQRAPNPTLLDYLPVTPIDLVELPDELSRRLFEALRLEIHYDHNTRTATCRVTLLGDTINAVSRMTQEAVVIPFPKQKGPAMEMQHDLPSGTVCVVPPAGLEPAT